MMSFLNRTSDEQAASIQSIVLEAASVGEMQRSRLRRLTNVRHLLAFGVIFDSRSTRLTSSISPTNILKLRDTPFNTVRVCLERLQPSTDPHPLDIRCLERELEHILMRRIPIHDVETIH